ncbi:MAG: DUF3857 domain-containing protein [Myxococcota bacterium]
MRLLLAAFVPLLLATPSLVQAQRSPYDAEIRRLSSEVQRRGRDARGMLPLLELESLLLEQRARPGTVRTALRRLADSRRLAPTLRVYAGAAEAYAMLDSGDFDEAVRRLRDLGYVTDWRIVGGFDDEGKRGFVRAYGPEEEHLRGAASEGPYEGRERPVAWRNYPSDLGRFGFVDFDATLRPYENACAYAETFVTLPRAGARTLSIGAGGAVKVWVNGEEVYADSLYRTPSMERDVVAFAGRSGVNRILVKTCVQERRWGFYLRVGDAAGGSPGTYSASAEPAALGDASTVRPARGIVSPLRDLEARVEADSDDAAARYDLARYLSWTGADDPADPKARQHAEAAAEDDRVEYALFASLLAETRAERMRFVAKAEEQSARDPRVRLARIELVASGPDPGRALRMLDNFPMNTRVGFDAAWLRTSLLEQRELREAAMAVIDEAIRRSGGALRWRLRKTAALEIAGHVEEAWTLKREVLELAQDDTSLRFEFMNDAYERGDNDEVFAHLDRLRSFDPADPRALQFAASVYEGLQRHDDALAIYRQFIGYAPDEAEHHARLGRAHLRLGQEAAAIGAFRDVLALRPQDAATRQLLERLRPRSREDEQWATDTAEILARREQRSDWHATTLHELQVVTVFDTGLASTFHQVAYQVHDEEGARSLDSYPIVYEPGRQYVEVRSAKVHRVDGTVVNVDRTFEQNLGDSRYRIYYDTRALVLAMPQLQPGDTVELRYRVEDVSRRNMFNDYYGDVRYLQNSRPTKRLEHAILTPASRRFYFNTPNMRGLERTEERRGEQNVYRYVANNVEALRSEPGMPGPAETRPFLHISTYESWDDVGRWWWGLVQDQLRPDESLIRTTRDLVAGAASDREKVSRIYDWVIRNTRYVGLEFGIHGFKPYRITQIVRRGFGDCKDKASLIYAMLTIAGVDARIALIRTRRNGAIADTPASLAIFDHAIAYVPQFDLFLDGTAEMNGTNELPQMDQGTTTLIVGPEGAQLRQTPVLPADRNVRRREMVATLDAEGAAEVVSNERVVGSSASYYRNHFQAEALQNERLQRDLAGPFPGVEVRNQRFENLDDYELAPAFRWDGRVPQFAERANGRLLIAPSSLRNLTRSLAPLTTRRHNLELGSPQRYEEVRTVRMPTGARIVDMPAGGEVRSEFGSLSVRYERRGRDIVATTEWELSVPSVARDDYPAFRRFVGELDVLLRQRVSVAAQ